MSARSIRAVLMALVASFAVPAVANANPAPATAAARTELNRISLITTDGYRPSANEKDRGFSEFSTSLGLAFFGNFYASNMLDVKGDIEKTLSSPELGRYFPQARERAQIASSIEAQLKRRFFDGGVTNESANGAIRYAVTDIGTRMVNRILEKEGVKDGARRNLWANRLLLPFHSCMREARVYKEGMRCLEAFKKDAVLNLGLGLSYELVRQEMGPAQTDKIPASYKTCLKANAAGAAGRIKGCITKQVASAAAAYGESRLLAVARGQISEASAKAVVVRALPGFRKCLDGAQDRAGFGACGDKLAMSAGAEIAREAVLQNAQLQGEIASPAQRLTIAEAGKLAFAACATKVEKANLRGADGNLKIDACAQPVRMEASRQVALEVIRQNIQKSSNAPAETQGKVQKTIANALEACWKNEASAAVNSDCLRDAIRRLVRAVAAHRLTQELPPDIAQTEPALKESLLGAADTCLAEKLKGNLLEASDIALRVEACSAPIVRGAAVRVAGAKLRDTLRGKSKDPEFPLRLQRELVDEKFAACLGPKPDSPKINACAAKLRQDAGIAAGRALFAENFDEFVKTSGGLAVLKLKPADREAFLARLLGSHEACLASKVKGSEAAAEAALDACFKVSIRELATYLGALEFRRQLAENVGHAKLNADALARDFTRDLAGCLAEKDKSPLTDYVTHIDTCRGRLTKKYTLEIGRRELAAVADENIPPTAANKAHRDSVLKELNQGFAACLDRAPNDAGARATCAAELKREATRALVVEATRAQSRKLLNTGDLPPARQRELEAQFKTCVAKTGDAESCAKAHVKEAAKAIAHLKLHHTMADMLGADYPKRLEELYAFERAYHACLDRIPGAVVDAAFVKATEACAAELEAQGVELSQAQLKKLLLTGGQGPKEESLSLQAALIVPCLDAIAVQKPFDEEFLKRYDPEGTFEILAKMVGDYINYDAEKAGDDYETVMAQVVTDLQAAGPAAARRKLLQTLIERGMIDQLLKSMILAEVKKKFAELPEADRPPPEVAAVLLSRGLLDKVLNAEAMARFRPYMAEKILKPLLLEGKSMKAPAQAEAIRVLKNQVAEALLEHPDFGGVLLTTSVQKKIDSQKSYAVLTWIGMKLKGYRTLYWSEARDSEKGRAAEAYIREKVIRPQFLGESVSAEEQRVRLEEADRLVKEALKLAP